MLELNLETILLSIINFIILLVIVQKVFLNKIIVFLNERKQGIIDKFEKIKDENFKITQEKNELKKKKEQSITEGKEIVNRYRQKAITVREEMVKEANKEAEDIRKKSSMIIKEEEANYVKKMKGITKEVSVELCKKVLCDVLDENAQVEILEAYIDRLEQNDV